MTYYLKLSFLRCLRIYLMEKIKYIVYHIILLLSYFKKKYVILILIFFFYYHKTENIT